LPVDYTPDLFAALDLQDELQTQYTGGTVLHGFIGEKLTKEGVKKIVRKIAENYKLPYFTITPTFSICPKHGYLSGEHVYCPKCDMENGFDKEQETEASEIKMANRAQTMDAIRNVEVKHIMQDSPAEVY
jgi:ribonucleoside-triphosphate reductase